MPPSWRFMAHYNSNVPVIHSRLTHDYQLLLSCFATHQQHFPYGRLSSYSWHRTKTHDSPQSMQALPKIPLLIRNSHRWWYPFPTRILDWYLLQSYLPSDSLLSSTTISVTTNMGILEIHSMQIVLSSPHYSSPTASCHLLTTTNGRFHPYFLFSLWYQHITRMATVTPPTSTNPRYHTHSNVCCCWVRRIKHFPLCLSLISKQEDQLFVY